MKIAYLTPEYPHKSVDYSSGGIGTSIYNLVHGLVKLKQEIIVLVYNQSKDEIIQTKGYKIYKIKNRKLKGISWWLTRKKIEKLINKLHTENKVDIVEAPDWTGMTSFMKLDCPLVIKLHGSDTYFCRLENRKSKWWNRFHEKKALRSAHGHISVSKFTANKTNEIFGLDIKFEIIPNGVNVDDFYSEPKSKAIPKTILYLGTLIRKKGVLEIPFIFNKLIEKKTNAKLVLVGKDNFDIITGSISTWGLMKTKFTTQAFKNVSFVGEVSYNKVKTYLEKADVVIFPSLAEALPVSWLEAMAMKKVVVASNIGWATEVIEHGVDGFLANPTNHKQFASQIVKAFRTNQENEKIAKRARQKIIQHFSNSIITEKNLNYYRKVLHGKRN